MKLLATIKDKDVLAGAEEVDVSQYHERLAACAVLFDNDGNVALLHVTKHNYHKLPGGGVEEGESLEQGLRRELLEETGCEAEIGQEVGEIVDCREKIRGRNDSFCWIAKVVGAKGDTSFVADEIDDQYKLEWAKLDEAIETMKTDKPTDYHGFFIQKRDLLFLEEAKKLI